MGPGFDIPIALPGAGRGWRSDARYTPIVLEQYGYDMANFSSALFSFLPPSLPLDLGQNFERPTAMARECVAIALSPSPYFDMGKTYVVHLGANGNLSTVFRRRLPSGTEAIDSSYPSRVCTDQRYQPYWVVLQGGKLSAGVGPTPGKRSIGTLDDMLYNQLRSGLDAVRYVGLGNSALSRNSRDVRIRGVRAFPIPAAFGGAGGIPIEEAEEGGFINVSAGTGGTAQGAAAGMPSEAELLAEYEKECAKAKARAAKFGTEYTQPPPDAFFKWSEARRLRANPERGFATGFDVLSPEERLKAQQRKERFAEEDRKRRRGMGEDVEEPPALESNPQEDGEMDDDEAAAAAMDAAAGKGPLPVEQAWDNEDLVGDQRLDPPEELYHATSEQREDADEQDRVKMEGEEKGEKPVLVLQKIHVFGIDWAAFKQIRSDDIMAHFKMYGPSYVEWLGELSCNVLFEDKFSAARALAALSQELPSPPPEGIVGVGNVAPNGDIASTVLGGDDAAMEDGEGAGLPGNSALATPLKTDIASPPTDLGGMGWRLCSHPIRKVINDRYGKRGTRSRVIMRIATSFDVLVERPTEWPRPPPGFTTRRVLGPGSDFDTGHRRTGRKAKRRRRSGGRGGRRRSDEGDGGMAYDDEVAVDTRLGQGLQAGRSGFSVEEIEAEREARRKAAADGMD